MLQLLFCIPQTSKISLTLHTKLKPLILWGIFWGMLLYATCASSSFCVVTVTRAFSLAILCKHLIPSPIFTHASHFQVPLRAVAEISPHSMEQCFKTLRLPRPGSRLLRLFRAYAWCNTHLNGRTGLGLGVRKQWDNKLTCVVYRQACDQLDHHTASRLRQQQVYLRSKWWGPEV